MIPPSFASHGFAIGFVIAAIFVGVAWLLYPFILFPFLLRLFAGGIQKRLARTWFQADRDQPAPKSIAVLFCAHNEEPVLREKFENLVGCARKCPVPARIYVFLDGCTDGSQAIAESFSPEVTVVASPSHCGKSFGMRALAAHCTEDILVFTDANVLFTPDLLESAINHFASDATLGCVAGSTAFTNATASVNARVEGSYWKREETLKQLESTTGSCLCGTGAIFAIRRSLFVPPPDDIIDDFHTTLNILFQRRRVIQSDALLVFERAATKPKDEWRRKVRISCRAYNCYTYLRSEIDQLPFPLRFIFYSHKWLRWFSAIPFTFVTLGFVVLVFLLSPAAGAGVALALALTLRLGFRGIWPFADVVAVFRAFYATLWGVILSWRGHRFVTWTPAPSTRSDLSRSLTPIRNDGTAGKSGPLPARAASTLKVLLVVEPGLDGVFRHVEGLVDFLLGDGMQVNLAYSSQRCGPAMLQLAQRVRASGGETMDMRIANTPQLGDASAVVRLTGFIRRLKPDVVHAHSSKSGVLARFAALFVRGPRYFYTPHAYYGMAKPPLLKVRFFNWIEHLIGRIGTTIAISQDEADFGQRVLGVPPERIHIIHNPVDTDRFFPPSPAQRQAARAALGIPEKTVVLATIGRMCWQKDPETAYGGVAPVCAQNPDLLYLHLGWGKWKEYLLGLGQRLGFGQQLRILAYTDNPQTFYHALDGVLITSRYEAGWALVLLEALACNLPVAVATSPGMSDIGRAGLSHLWTFPPEQRPACTAAVQQWLLAHREGRNSYNHRDFVMARLSPSRCYGALVELYRNESSVSNVSPLADGEKLKAEGLKN
jgi:glycosyltransferase involved in cell wall biosynthesis/cellulose synthase/poly-beta-1,6-N-acetylglucosamine synthase-like glycosyltransferase